MLGAESKSPREELMGAFAHFQTLLTVDNSSVILKELQQLW
jgi:hypothetical protein